MERSQSLFSEYEHFLTKTGFSPHKAELLLQSMELKNEKHIGMLIRNKSNLSLNTRLKGALYGLRQL